MPCSWQVALPGEVCAVLVTTLVLEGWSSRLAPEHSVLEQARQRSPSPDTLAFNVLHSCRLQDVVGCCRQLSRRQRITLHSLSP